MDNEKMTAKEFRERLSGNAWDWDLYEFARRTGLRPDTEHTKDKFLSMRRASEALREFDDRLLEIITAPRSAQPALAS